MRTYAIGLGCALGAALALGLCLHQAEDMPERGWVVRWVAHNHVVTQSFLMRFLTLGVFFAGAGGFLGDRLHAGGHPAVTFFAGVALGMAFQGVMSIDIERFGSAGENNAETTGIFLGLLGAIGGASFTARGKTPVHAPDPAPILE